MSVSSISSFMATSGSTSGAARAASSSVGKDDFLRLLVSQLQHQDPLSPQDPSEFTAQLAQFSSLEQLVGVNDNLTGMLTQQVLNSRLSAASYIGRTARVSGDMITVAQGTASQARFNLPAGAARTTVNVYNSSGALVRTVDLGAQAAGDHDFQWDGRSSAGSAAADGSYRFEVVAYDQSGQRITANTSFTGTVTGVTFDGADVLLQIGGQSWSLTDLLSIGT